MAVFVKSKLFGSTQTFEEAEVEYFVFTGEEVRIYACVH